MHVPGQIFSVKSGMGSPKQQENKPLKTLHVLSWPGALKALHEADRHCLLAETRTPRLQIDNSSIWCTAWRLHAGLLMKQVRFSMAHHSLAEIVLAPCIANLLVRHFQLVQCLLKCEMCLQHASVLEHWLVDWNLAHTA